MTVDMRTIEGVEEKSINWLAVRDAWRELALVLLTTARQRFDLEAFNNRLAALSPFLNDNQDVVQQIHYEKCLWALYELDFKKLDELLKEWRPGESDPLWMVRKAALLAEQNRDDEAARLLNNSLLVIRENSREGRNLINPSREGWILLLSVAFEPPFSQAPSTEKLDAPPAFSRWEQLARFHCDAFAQKKELLGALKGDAKQKEEPLFDLGARREILINSSNMEYKKQLYAYRAIRLCEVAGLPPSACNVVVGSDILTAAADNLITVNQMLAFLLVLRLVKSENDKIFDRIWSRYRIGGIPMELVDKLVDIVTNAISFALPRVTLDDTGFWLTRLRVAIEALSRLVLRLPQNKAEKIFIDGLSYYSNDIMPRHFWLSKVLVHLLVRSWEVMSSKQKANHILQILSTPINGVNGFEAPTDLYLDPVELIADDSELVFPDRNLKTEGCWTEIFQQMINGLEGAGKSRTRAALRLVPLVRRDLLTKTEKEDVIKALWCPTHMDKYLPGGTGLSDWEFLILPEPTSGVAEQRFREKWLHSKETKNRKQINRTLYNVGMAILFMKNHGKQISFTTEDQATLLATIEKWIEFPFTVEDNFINRNDDNAGIVGLKYILLEMSLSPSVVKGVLNKILTLNQTEIPYRGLLVSIVKYFPDRIDEIAVSIQMGILSDNLKEANNAIWSIYFWLKSSIENNTVPSVPSGLIQEIGVIIATRRMSVLDGALQTAHLIFSSGSTEQRKSIEKHILHGLSYLIEELRYNRAHIRDNEDQIPLLRWACAHLAQTMSLSGYNNESSVLRWKEIIQNDPLPEVRYAKGS